MRLSHLLLLLLGLGACHQPMPEAASVPLPPPEKQELRIIGGAPASTVPSSFAALAASESRDIFCGATLIAPDVLLTAAHCLEDLESPLLVYPRPLDRLALEPSQGLKPERIVVHPAYDSRAIVNDIGLIFLPAGTSAGIAGFIPTPLSHDRGEAEALGEGSVYGFGQLSNYGTLPADELRRTVLPTIDRERCQGLDPIYASISEQQICVGELEQGGQDSCQGDSGGALYAEEEGAVQKVLGLVSWGVSCAQRQSPGIYTRVAAYRDWIEATIRRAPAGTGDELVRERCYWGVRDVFEREPETGLWQEERWLHFWSPLAEGPGQRKAQAGGGESLASPCAPEPGTELSLWRQEQAAEPRYTIQVKKGELQSERDLAVSKTWHAVSCASEGWLLYWLADGGTLYGPGLTQDLIEARQIEDRSPTLLFDCERKGLGFSVWADVAGDEYLRLSLARGSSETWLLSERRGPIALRLEDHGRELLLENRTGEDVYSYELACPFAFSLRLAKAPEEAALAGADGQYRLRSLYSGGTRGFIARDATLRFGWRGPKNIEACTLNGEAVSLKGEASPLSGEQISP